MSVMIKVFDVSKEYLVYDSYTAKALNFLSLDFFWKPERVRVLNNVSFNISKGETVGLIGPNGAGKSTLLKVIQGLTKATSGNVYFDGRIGSLIELGAGFHPELSGRENAITYLNLQDKVEDIESKIESILEFSELAEYFDAPFKTYSTGMQVRLGFAVSTVLYPEILIIDEALAVGDEYFQNRCIDRIKSMQASGVTMLFVSHSNPLVEMLCDRAIYIDHGNIIADGDVTDVIRLYSNDTAKKRSSYEKSKKEISFLGTEDVEVAFMPQSEIKKPEIIDIGSNWGNKKIKIIEFEIKDKNGNEKKNFLPGDEIIFKFKTKSSSYYESIVLGLSIFDSLGTYIFGSNNYDIHSESLNHHEGIQNFEFRVVNPTINPGTFFCTYSIYTEPQYPFWTDPADYYYKASNFKIEDVYPSHGVVRTNGIWSRR